MPFLAPVPRLLAPLAALSFLALAPLRTGAAGAQIPARDSGGWGAVQEALGGGGTMQPGGVLKFAFPRTDLQVTIDRTPIAPALALGSWVAFRRVGGGTKGATTMMGDLVLTEGEVGPVMAALQQGGVEQTALHNHVLAESPRVMYLHVAAHGDAAKIAAAVRAALGATKTPTPGSTPAASAPAASTMEIDTAALARTLGAHGKVNGGVYQVAVPRLGRVTDHGVEIPPAMGVATAINFQPTGEGRAAVTGDFVMTAGEVNPVIRALHEHGIQVTALHSHMLTETPRLFFMHFWANDDAAKLAQGLRAALDRMAVRRVAAR